MKEIKKHLKVRSHILTDCENVLNRINSRISTIVEMVDKAEVITQWPEPFENVFLVEVVKGDQDSTPLVNARLFCEYTRWEVQIQTPKTTWGPPLLQLKRSCNTPYLPAIRVALVAAEKQLEAGLLKSLKRGANYPLEEK